MSLSRRALAALVAAAGLALAPASAGAIVGGTNAPAGKYPSVAKVTIGLFGCTGTLVAPRWVLTAGHCSSLTGAAGVATPANYPPQAFAVTVDAVEADGSDGERVTVDGVTIPPDYLLSDGYDVSLLHLAAPAKAAPTPVAGKGYEALSTPSVLTEIVGFGATKEGGDAPPIVQQASVPILPDASCARAYPDSFEPGTQLCAGYPQGGTDSCQGDSGGPMFSRTAAALFVVGSTSYGRGCARPNTPGVYARVADVTLREGFIRKAAPDAVADLPAGTATPTPSPATSTSPTQSVTPAGPGSVLGPVGATRPAPGTSGGRRAPGSTTMTTTPSGTAVAATTTRSGFRAVLAVNRALRRTVRARGLRFSLRCSTACSAKIRLRVSAATARRLRLVSRTVGTTTVTRDTAGRTAKSIRISRTVARRLKADRGAALSVVATVRQTPRGPSAVLAARPVLTEKQAGRLRGLGSPVPRVSRRTR